MSRICPNCGNKIPWQTKINDKLIDLRGRKFCLDCNSYKERRFYKRKLVVKNSNGKYNIPKISKICKICNKTYTQRTKGTVCSTCKSKKIRKERKDWAVELKGGKCNICGYNKYTCSFTFHHLDPSKKILIYHKIIDFLKKN